MFPPGFKDIYYSVYPSNADEALTILLHTYLLEVGFKPKNFHGCNVYKLMPENWKGNGIFKMEYIHNKIEERVSDKYCCVTFVPLSANIAVHGTIDDTDESVYLNLPVSFYVNPNADLSRPSEVFRCPNEISIYFKDKFCFPLIAAIEKSIGCRPSFGLSALVEEIKVYLLKMLPVETVVSLSGVNKSFYELGNSPEFWKFLLLRDFGSVLQDSSSENNWKDIYKRRYLQRRALQPVIVDTPAVPPSLYPFNFGYDSRINLDPALQQEFPQLRSRFRPRSPFYPFHRYK